ncbi:MAG: hypothetical protein U1E36_02235 [Rickettsiales bacterium]
MTGQPDFAHLVIDYVPNRYLVESKSLKLYLTSFRNHGAFHEDCTIAVARGLVDSVEPTWSFDRRLLVSTRRHSHRYFLPDVRASRKHVWIPETGVPTYRGRGCTAVSARLRVRDPAKNAGCTQGKNPET